MRSARTILGISATLAVGAAATERLSNPGFEDGSGTSSGWWVNSWGNPAPSGTLSTAPSPLEGTRAQRVRVTGTGHQNGWIYRQDLVFRKGSLYRGVLHLRSPDSALVQVMLRRAEAPYEPAATRSVKAGPGWNRIAVEGGFPDSADVSGFFGISLRSDGTVDIDSASVVELPAPALRNLGQPIPATLFGMHFNRYGRYRGDNWPAPGFGTLRLWDCGTQWAELETAKGRWNWTLMDTLVHQARLHGQQIVYAMGQTPRWASARPGESGIYRLGSSAEPASLADWGTYVATVARRYKGMIKGYELWNESDQSRFCTIPAATLAAMARIAHDSLRTIDPDARLLSPNITQYGLSLLDDFLRNGGGAWIDAASYHHYLPASPELGIGPLAGVRNVLSNHGLDTLPVWNTEGACEGTDTTTLKACLLRSYLTMWTGGVPLYGWYGWDLFQPLASPDDVPNAMGKAYASMTRWLTGARLTSDSSGEDGSRWIGLDLANGRNGKLAWSPSGKLPLDLRGWNQAQFLDGDSTASLPQAFELGAEPILLLGRNGASGIRASASKAFGLHVVLVSPRTAALRFHSLEDGKALIELRTTDGRLLSRSATPVATGAQSVLLPLPSGHPAALATLRLPDGSASTLRLPALR